MPLCTICCLPARTRRTIDAALFSGVGYRKVAAKYSSDSKKFSYATVARHHKHAFPSQLRRQPPPPDSKAVAGVLDRIEGVIAELRAIAASPAAKRMPSLAIAALKEVLRGLETLGKATGEVPTGGINMNFLNGIFSEDQLTAFFDSIKRRPESMAMFNRLIETKLGRVAPVVHINFVKSDGDGRPALSSAPTDDEVSHAALEGTSGDGNRLQERTV